MRSGTWRFIRYADGSQELYDRSSDPNEWNNLATKAKYRRVMQELAAFLPALDDEAPNAPTDPNLKRGKRTQKRERAKKKS